MSTKISSSFSCHVVIFANQLFFYLCICAIVQFVIMYPFPFENFLNLFPRFSRFYYRITCPWEGLEVFCLVNMVTTYNSKISENENCWLPKAHVCEHMPLLCFQDPSVFKPVALICCDGLNREECTCAIHTDLRTKSSSPHWLEILHLFSPLLSEVFSGQRLDWDSDWLAR